MKVNVNIEQDNMKINETFFGRNAEEVVTAMKARVAREAGFAMRMMINAASPLMFAQEVVKRYNDSNKTNLPIPRSCEEFLQTATNLNIATIEET